jgi:hypothetical protein
MITAYALEVNHTQMAQVGEQHHSDGQAGINYTEGTW